MTETLWIPDATAIETFRENPELFRLKFRKHLVPSAVEEAPHSGKAFHAALNVWFDTRYQPTPPMVAREAAMNALREAWGDSPIMETSKRPLGLFESLLQEYTIMYEQEQFKVVHNERRLRAVNYCGIIDRVIEYPDGSRFVMDTKTTSAWLNQDYFDMFAVGAQMIGYVWLVRGTGMRCDGYIIDGVHVDTRYQKVKPERDFVRSPQVFVKDWMVERWRRDIDYTMMQIDMLDETRGPDVPWPIYKNFMFGKKGPYWDFFVQPPELHAATELEFAKREWKPWEAE